MERPMNKLWVTLASASVFMAQICSAQPIAPDLILHHGKIVAVDNGFSIYQAIAVRDSRIQRSAVAVHVEVLVGLATTAAGANVEIERDRSLDKSCVVREDLRSALAPRIP